MDNIYSLGSSNWRKWGYSQINKLKEDNEGLSGRVSELEDLVIALLPENAFITGDGSYLTTTDGKNLIVTI